MCKTTIFSWPVIVLSILFLSCPSCEILEEKCTNDLLENRQRSLTFFNIDDYSEILEDGTIIYTKSFAFLEVCTKEKMNIDASVGMISPNPKVQFTPQIMLHDVDDAIGMNWTPMEYTTYDDVYYYNLTNQGIYVPSDKQETIIWVRIRLTVPPGQGMTVDEIHYQMGFETFYHMTVSLYHHKPVYE